MDLGAFLRPGGGYSLTAVGEGRMVRGRLISRRGRPGWLFHEPQPAGRTLVLTVRLSGFGLEADGSLTPGGAGPAGLVLWAKVRACRRLPTRRLYLARLTLLGRIDPECQMKTGSL